MAPEFLKKVKELQSYRLDAKRVLPFQQINKNAKLSILFLGDSLQVGVGAVPKKTIAGLFGKLYPASHIENHAVTGARTKDVLSQLDRALKERYDLILISVGGNDVIRFTRKSHVEKELKKLIDTVKKRSKKVVLSMCGRIDYVPQLPASLKKHYKVRQNELNELFIKIAKEKSVLFIDLLNDELINIPFRDSPEIYFGKDGFHPAAKGYVFSFKKFKSVLKKEEYLP
ncbi:MAG: SGNH/GDSL hydrolase family protein [Candidatus Nanoarchaeia archaeon]